MAVYDVCASRIALMKIMHDNKKYNKFNFSLSDLHDFAVKVINLANKDNKFNDYHRLLHFGMQLYPLDLLSNVNGDGISDWNNVYVNFDAYKCQKNAKTITREYINGIPAGCLQAIYNIFNQEDKLDKNVPIKSSNARKR